jgi:hypothetical protein
MNSALLTEKKWVAWITFALLFAAAICLRYAITSAFTAPKIPASLQADFDASRSKYIALGDGAITDMRLTDSGKGIVVTASDSWYRMTPTTKRQFAAAFRDMAAGLRTRNGLDPSGAYARIEDPTGQRLATAHAYGTITVYE